MSDFSRIGRIIAVVAGVVFLGLLLWIFGRAALTDQSGGGVISVNRPARSFSLKQVYGTQVTQEKHVSIEALKGKKVILNFWAIWCETCREEAKVLEAFWRGHKNSNIIVIGIAIDSREEDVARFAAYYGKTYPLLLDQTGRVGVDYGITGVPETFYINEKGILVSKYVGSVSQEVLDGMIEGKSESAK